jgi:hypothetical protein
MKDGRYHIFEITDEGFIKKVSLADFKTKEEAENSINSMCHPLHPHELIAIKTHD